ncbi:MAG: phage tail protein [Deltaproteobacteria bacterium]|nr:phage tail protein [Deltaproteobacteria bacterium]
MSSGIRHRSTPATKRPYSTGHFELSIDGHVSTAYLKSVDGGNIKGQTIEEAMGGTNARIKHMSGFDIEPMTIDFGISGAGDVLKWIQSSWDRDWGRRSGQITHGNFEFTSTFEHEFRDALIMETTFPTLDGASKEAAYLKLKIQPEVVIFKKGSGRSISANLGSKQKSWMPSAFRLYLDDLDELKYTNKIEGFSIKQGVKKLKTGEERFAEIEPTKIEYPNLVGTIALEYADKLQIWAEKVLKKGWADPKAQKTGRLEFLDPTRTKVLFQINLFEVGLHDFKILQSTANADQIKRAKFDLHVGQMKLDGKSLGLE